MVLLGINQSLCHTLRIASTIPGISRSNSLLWILYEKHNLYLVFIINGPKKAILAVYLLTRLDDFRKFLSTGTLFELHLMVIMSWSYT